MIVVISCDLSIFERCFSYQVFNLAFSVGLLALVSALRGIQLIVIALKHRLDLSVFSQSQYPASASFDHSASFVHDFMLPFLLY